MEGKMGVLNFFSRTWGGGLKGQRRVGGFSETLICHILVICLKGSLEFF